MDFPSLLDKIALQFRRKLPFAVYSFPSEHRVHAYFQKSEPRKPTAGFPADGFVFAPFQNELPLLQLAAEDCEIFEVAFSSASLEEGTVAIPEEPGEEERYLALLRQTIEKITSGEAEKIVISRKKKWELKNFEITTLVQRIFASQPAAFRYLWFHPESALWAGATPEILVDVQNGDFKTMALAGTKPLSNKDIDWGGKEREEQQMVTDAILRDLEGLVRKVRCSPVHTHRAGSLLHLRTDIQGELNSRATGLMELAEALHPTPAVCGWPKTIARNFIVKNEGYKREFYTGFLGPLHDRGNSATLMVNLRCLKIHHGHANIYVGGGITADSVPVDEWVETQNKMQTMLQVLRPML